MKNYSDYNIAILLVVDGITHIWKNVYLHEMLNLCDKIPTENWT